MSKRKRLKKKKSNAGKMLGNKKPNKAMSILYATNDKIIEVLQKGTRYKLSDDQKVLLAKTIDFVKSRPCPSIRDLCNKMDTTVGLLAFSFRVQDNFLPA